MLLSNDQEFKFHHGDCIPHMAEMPPQSVDLCIHSVPFPLIFAYSSDIADIGNSEDMNGESKLNFMYFFKFLLPVMKPGRVVAVHCTQVAKLKRSGEVGLYDFRGLLIRIAQRAGFVYEYDWTVRQCPQAQAIRTRKWELKFQGLESDRAVSRGALCDYIIKLRAPGENEVPIRSRGDVSRNDWIEWAEGTWSDIKMTNTLNTAAAKSDDDTRHICPMSLDMIERLVRLYSNPGEIVFDPFAGIGSTAVKALELGRRAYGCELKPEYFREANKNCLRVVSNRRKVASLFGDDDGSGEFAEFTSADSEFDPKVGV